jgi:hypothetical protein
MGRNPKDSPWYSTPRAKRRRQGITLTLPPEALDALEVLAQRYGSRSAAVEALIMGAGGR